LTSPSEIAIRLDAGGVTTALVYEARERRAAAPALILGHGAGAGQRSAFMVEFAKAFAALGIDTITFNFLYSEQHRRIPDRAPALEACYRAVIEEVRRSVIDDRRALFIGGKSMGGRIATQVAAADSHLVLAGLVLLGYPLHPPGRPAERRDKHLPSVRRPMLFVQGARDAFGTPSELETVLTTLRPRPTMHVVGGGDHSFKVGRKDPAAQTAVFDDVQRTIADWIGEVASRKSRVASPDPQA
jgi:predicted alpha/beta-hydrolase family hydrolase